MFIQSSSENTRNRLSYECSSGEEEDYSQACATIPWVSFEFILSLSCNFKILIDSII